MWSQTTGYGLERTLSQWYKKEEPSYCWVDCLSQESKNPARPKRLQFSGQSPGKESVARIYHSGDVRRAPGSSVKDWSAHSCEKLLKDEKDRPKGSEVTYLAPTQGQQTNSLFPQRAWKWVLCRGHRLVLFQSWRNMNFTLSTVPLLSNTFLEQHSPKSNCFQVLPRTKFRNIYGKTGITCTQEAKATCLIFSKIIAVVQRSKRAQPKVRRNINWNWLKTDTDIWLSSPGH